MEAINDAPHPDYIKSFNDGYLIAKELPELSKELVKSLSDTEQSKGFEAGVRQVFLEKLRTLEPVWSKEQLPTKEKDKSKDSKGMERD